jgi:formate hydrogenlyase subunit 3/multisubunit Na+/H+ antiporter MnhD subunit
MSAPLAWIILPGIAGGVLLLLRGRQRVTVILGISLALILAALMFWIPINEVVNLRGWSFKLSDTLEFFGRRMVLENKDRPVLALSYLMAAFWFCAAYTAHTTRIFVPLCLGLISLLTAALAVQPFLFAALLIEMAVFVCIPLLSPPGNPLGRGVLRFFTFQTLGMPFILFTGWMLAGVEASPGDVFLIIRVGILLGFGFAFLIGIFPFHTWLPMLSEETHPY